jgi:hypothetical protein
MTITLKIGLFVGTCILYVLTARLMRSLLPTWPEGGRLAIRIDDRKTRRAGLGDPPQRRTDPWLCVQL